MQSLQKDYFDTTKTLIYNIQYACRFYCKDKHIFIINYILYQIVRMGFMTHELGFSYMCSGLDILASVLKNKMNQ